MRLRAVQDFQRRANLARMLVPLAGRARETTLHDGANARWHVRWELRKRGLQDGRRCGGPPPVGQEAGACRMPAAGAAAIRSAKGRCPAVISYSTIPSDQMSLSVVAGSPFTTSGA